MRIKGRPPESAGPFLRLIARVARRKTRQITGRETERMIEPMNAYALLPRLLLGYGALEDATSKLHHVPERVKMLAELKAATLTNCEYCIDIGSQIARQTGLSDEELLALPHAVGKSRTPVDVPDGMFAELMRHFDETQIVELTNVIALENMRGRFNLALGIGSAGFTEGMVCAVPERLAPAPAEVPVGMSA
jgi:4-carboxymuconolactone decarboxylase